MPKLTDHMLEILKGFDVEMPKATLGLDPSVTITIYRGRCVSVNPTSQKFVTGCLGNQIAHFVITGSDEGDVSNDANGWGYSAIPDNTTRLITAIPATAATELATTEYDTTQNYNINDPLRAVNADTNQATGGTLTNAGVTVAPPGTSLSAVTATVGRVSRLPAKRQVDRPPVLCFYPHVLPGATGL